MPDLDHYDQDALKLGMILAFCEVVMQEVKDLAFSPILEPEEWQRLREPTEAIAGRFSVKFHVETGLVPSDLVPDEAIQDKVVVLFYKQDRVLQAYFSLKEKVIKLQDQGLYTEAERQSASQALRRLLSYSEEAIQAHYA